MAHAATATATRQALRIHLSSSRPSFPILRTPSIPHPRPVKRPQIHHHRLPSPPTTRTFHAAPIARSPPAAAPPKSKDRGPKSDEDTQTDFNALDILSQISAPTTAVDSCLEDGFALDSGLHVTGSGVLLVSGEAFKWKPWVAGRQRVLNAKGQFDVDQMAWGILDLVWPKPDLLVLGTGGRMVPVSAETRARVNELGIRLEVLDTRNAAAHFNLLATERGVQQVAAALVPLGWKE